MIYLICKTIEEMHCSSVLILKNIDLLETIFDYNFIMNLYNNNFF